MPERSHKEKTPLTDLTDKQLVDVIQDFPAHSKVSHEAMKLLIRRRELYLTKLEALENKPREYVPA
jgi:hypothetical protein